MLDHLVIEAVRRDAVVCVRDNSGNEPRETVEREEIKNQGASRGCWSQH